MMGFSRAIAFASITMLGGVAMAQPKPTPAEKQKIQELAKRAISKSQAGDHEGAVADLLEAYRINTTAAVVLLSNVGYEYKQLKRPVDALKYYCMYLEQDPTGSAAQYVSAEAKTLHKDLQLPGEPCAKKADKKPPPIDFNDGGNGSSGTVTPNHTDGQVTGTSNLSTTTTASPSDPGKSMKWAGIGVGVAGAAVLGAGIYFGTQAKDRADQITAGPPIDPDTGMQVDWGPHPELGWDGITKLQDDGHKFEKLQVALTITGAAMVVGGGALYFFGARKHAETTVTPTAGPDSVGVSLGGSF